MVSEQLPKIYFFTGAGISAESGLPTFRGNEGSIWNSVDVRQICDIHTFRENHQLVNKFYREYYDTIMNTNPNDAHRAIAEYQQRYGTDRVKIITTNVDDLHERAGATEVLHLHGDIRYNILDFDGERKVVPVECTPPAEAGTYTKPAVVFFGESVRFTGDGVKHPLYEELYNIIDNINQCDIVIVVGASFQVVPFDYLLSCTPAYTININIEDNAINGYFKSTLIDGATQGLKKCNEFINNTMEGKL